MVLLLYVLLILPVAIGWYTKTYWLRCVMVVAILITLTYLEVSIEWVGRSVVVQAAKDGRATEGFGRGVNEALDIVVAYRPYILVGVLGLAILALRKR
jgi:hypothetical protein